MQRVAVGLEKLYAPAQNAGKRNNNDIASMQIEQYLKDEWDDKL